jgi:hypothetical protein
VVDGKQVMPCMMNTGVQESTVGKVVVLYSPMHGVGLALYEVERRGMRGSVLFAFALSLRRCCGVFCPRLVPCHALSGRR